MSAQSCELGQTRSGELFVSGNGSKLSLSQDLSVGFFAGGIVRVDQQGRIDCDFGSLGTFSVVGGSVIINGDGSIWNVRRGLVGGDSGYGILNIRAGGQVRISAGGFVFVGFSDFMANGEIDISGTGSLLDATSALVVVGGEGTGRLNLFESGELRAQSFTLGSGQLSYGSVEVTDLNGPGALLDVTEDIIVGKEGQGRLLIGFGSGDVLGQARTLYIGQSFYTNIATVNGAKALLDLSGDLFIGDGGFGTLAVTAGGHVTVGGFNIMVSSKPISKGSLLVDGAGSKVELLRKGSDLVVGDRANGELKVTRAGQVIVRGIAIGSAFASGIGEVADANSLLRVMNQAQIGFAQSSGSLSVRTNAMAQIDHDLVLARNGSVLLSGGRVNVGGPGTTPPMQTLRVADGGTLSGDGTATANVVVESGGRVVVGDPLDLVPIGRLRVEGDYEHRAAQSAASQPTLELDIAGLTPETQHDVLDVTNTVRLAGNLVVHFVNGFAPTAGQQFDIIWFAKSLTGDFANVQITGLAPGFQYELKVTSPGRYSLVAVTDGVATSPPALAIALGGGTLVISWPTNVTSFTLQTTTNLLLPVWFDRPTVGNRLSVTPAGSAAFYRLIKR